MSTQENSTTVYSFIQINRLSLTNQQWSNQFFSTTFFCQSLLLYRQKQRFGRAHSTILSKKNHPKTTCMCILIYGKKKKKTVLIPRLKYIGAHGPILLFLTLPICALVHMRNRVGVLLFRLGKPHWGVRFVGSSCNKQ